MRFAWLTAAAFLSGCGGGASSTDPCTVLGEEKLSEIAKSTVTKKELTGPREVGGETVSTCDVDFSDGQWLTISLARRDKPIDDATLATYSHRDSTLSAQYGFPIFYDGEKDLEAFPKPDRRAHLRMGKNAGQGYAQSSPANVADKLRAVLAAIPR
ncbi:hypothetical protein [Sphingomonas endolithica]|uniref:hypothetical protein n=1 Tax=Sphingomonas endolithica TaxID=2972485 RepID=UPI0021AF2966|nr:hypothetical protein [Sphingomonas sp. ZFBP2030]